MSTLEQVGYRGIDYRLRIVAASMIVVVDSGYWLERGWTVLVFQL